MSTTITIDGSYGEGGGQVLRTALSLSIVTGKPVELFNIRAGRSKPGLQRQHLTAVRAAAALCDAEISGAALGSVYLRFLPRRAPEARPYHFEIGTAGATTLVAQTLLLPLAHARVAARVTITGGTHVPHAPPADYLQQVYLPVLERVGIAAAAAFPAAGFYPKGGGRLDLDVSGGIPARLDLTERGELVRLRATVLTANLAEHVSRRGRAAVERALKRLGREAALEAIEERVLPSPGPGAAVFLAAECELGRAGFLGLGAPGKPMEQVAAEPCAAFAAWWESGAACDEHLADQLVLPLALAAGESRWTTSAVTEHLRTVLWVVGQFLPVSYRIEERRDGTGLVALPGAGAS